MTKHFAGFLRLRMLNMYVLVPSESWVIMNWCPFNSTILLTNFVFGNGENDRGTRTKMSKKIYVGPFSYQLSFGSLFISQFRYTGRTQQELVEYVKRHAEYRVPFQR